MSTTTEPRKMKSNGKRKAHRAAPKAKKRGIAAVAQAIAEVTADKAMTAAEALAIQTAVRPIEQINVERSDLEKRIEKCHYGQEHERLELEGQLTKLNAEVAISEALAESPRDAGIPDAVIRDLRINQILIDDGNPNHRIQTLAGDAETVRLANNIKAIKLQQPIAVMLVDGEDLSPAAKYKLIFGHRRLAAHVLNKAETIYSLVYPKLAPEQIRAIKAAENLQRKDLNPIEEAIAVAHLLDTVSPEKVTAEEVSDAPQLAGSKLPLSFDERVAKVAAYLGKSEIWVRDRAYLARLNGDARQLVLDGRLPLGHARELAKIADDETRDKVAHQCARREDDTGGYDLKWLRNTVEFYQNSLTQIPWKLDVPFAGKPACAACPFNSANDAKLFEHDQQPDKPRCLKPSCFGEKQRHAEKTIEVTIKGVAKAKKKEDFPLTETGLAAHTPREIKPSIMVRRTRKVLDPQSSKGSVAANGKKPAGPAPEEVARVEAKEAWYRLNHQWQESCHKVWLESQTPGCVLALCVMSALGMFGNVKSWAHEGSVKRTLKTQAWRTMMKMLASNKGPSLADLLKLVGKSKFQPSEQMHRLAFPVIIEAMGGKLPAPPVELDAYINGELAKMGLGKLPKNEVMAEREEGKEAREEVEV